MSQDLNFEDIYNLEREAENIASLNKSIFKKKNLILCVNIRSLNANYEKLETFIGNLVLKPIIIICTETWILQYPQYYQLQGYKSYYNESKINKADGVMLYNQSETLAK